MIISKVILKKHLPTHNVVAKFHANFEFVQREHVALKLRFLQHTGKMSR